MDGIRIDGDLGSLCGVTLNYGTNWWVVQWFYLSSEDFQLGMNLKFSMALLGTGFFLMFYIVLNEPHKLWYNSGFDTLCCRDPSVDWLL